MLSSAQKVAQSCMISLLPTVVSEFNVDSV